MQMDTAFFLTNYGKSEQANTSVGCESPTPSAQINSGTPPNEGLTHTYTKPRIHTGVVKMNNHTSHTSLGRYMLQLVSMAKQFL